MLGDASLTNDARFRRNVDRVDNRAETDALVARRFAALATDQLIGVLNDADIAFGLVSEVADVLKHPCLRQITIATPNGPAHVPAPPARVKGQAALDSAVPAIGSHNDAVRLEFLG